MINSPNLIGLADLLVWAIGSVFVCYQLSRRYPWTVALAFGITVFSALRIYQVSLNGIPSDPVLRQFSVTAQSALLSFLFSVMIAQALSIQSWVKIFKVVAVVNAVAICADSFYFATRGLLHHLPLAEISAHEPWGILLNASMSGCLSAAIFPLFDPKERALRCLVLISVVAAGRSLPIAVLFAGIGGLLYVRKQYRALAIAIPVSFAVGFLVKGHSLFAPRGRETIWTQALAIFHDRLPWAIGGGLGSFYVIGPTLTDKSAGVFFIWLHSDWLQTLFEQGFIGFNLVLLMYLHALSRARENPRLFASLVAYAAFGMANMPLRYPLAGILGAVLIRWAMEKPPQAAVLT